MTHVIIIITTTRMTCHIIKEERLQEKIVLQEFSKQERRNILKRGDRNKIRFLKRFLKQNEKHREYDKAMASRLCISPCKILLSTCFV